MKYRRFRLNKWYPSLPTDLTIDSEVKWLNGTGFYTVDGISKSFVISLPEISSKDYWSKLILVTDDGFRLYSAHHNVVAVLESFEQKLTTAGEAEVKYPGAKFFCNVSEADKYIKSLIVEPAFITHDHVKIFRKDIELYAVRGTTLCVSDFWDFEATLEEGWTVFFDEKRALEYRIANARVFSYTDIKNMYQTSYNKMFDNLKEEAIKRV